MPSIFRGSINFYDRVHSELAAWEILRVSLLSIVNLERRDFPDSDLRFSWLLLPPNGYKP